MTKKYTYQGDIVPPNTGPLPDGDYDYVVMRCGEPYESKAGNIVLSVELEIQASRKILVFYNPWVGVDRNGEKRDGIADFLHAIGRVPKIGEEPHWSSLVGARGRCRLTTEIAGAGKYQGQEVNKVHWLHRPHVAGEPKSYSADEFKAAREERKRQTGGEPDSIPF